MDGVVKGTTANAFVTGPVKVTSVMVTVSGLVKSDLHLHDGQNTTSNPSLHVAATLGATTQLHFKGIPFVDGFTVEPDSNCDMYVVEYETVGS